MKQNYESMVIEAANVPEYEQTYLNWAKAQAYADEKKVWFWRFRSPYSKQVMERQEIANKWQKELEQLDFVREQKMKQAKAYVGLFSEYGMSEIRQRFWDAYNKGKMFAQQQTFYQMFFRILSGQDEEFWSTIFNWIFVALVNFTTGLIGSLFYFFFSLIGMIYSYQPDPWSGTAFFILGLIGATSIIASYLFALYGMVVSGIYVVGKIIIRDAIEQEQERFERLQQQQQQQQQQHEW
jgi:5-carboxymethyl-2-hydroxymuconate isomerase